MRRLRRTALGPVMARPLGRLPMTIDDWTGQRLADVDEASKRVLGADDYLNRRYVRGEKSAVDLFVAFYASQRQGDAIHSPRNCLPGAGWQPVAVSTVPFVVNEGRTVTVNRYVIEKEHDRRLVYYWYQGRGRVVANEYANKALARRRRDADGAVRRRPRARHGARDARSGTRRQNVRPRDLHATLTDTAMKRIILLSLLVTAACGGDPSERARTYTASGDQYAAKGQLNEAVIEYRNAAKADPTQAEVFARLGRALRKLGRVADAYSALSRAAELNPRDAATQLEIASIELGEGDFQGARARAEQALRAEPLNAEAHVLLGSALLGLEKLDTAVDELERAVRLDPTHVGSFTALGSLRLFQGKRDEAAALLHKAAELESEVGPAPVGARELLLGDRGPGARRSRAPRSAGARAREPPRASRRGDAVSRHETRPTGGAPSDGPGGQRDAAEIGWHWRSSRRRRAAATRR